MHSGRSFGISMYVAATCSFPEMSFSVRIITRDVFIAVAEEASTESDPVDMLDKDKCIQLLAELRHAKWFQVGCSGPFVCL